MSADYWPIGNTPLVSGVQPPGFTSVTEEVLAEIVHHIVTALHPEKIVLFGSYAYGRPLDDSDVDLLVILETRDRPIDRYLAVSRLLRPRPFPSPISAERNSTTIWDETAQVLPRKSEDLRQQG